MVANTPNADSHEEDINLWQSLLRDSSRRSKIPHVNVVLLGESTCGKSMLLKCMIPNQSSEINNTLKEYSISYSSFDLYDPNQSGTKDQGDVLTSMGIWSLSDSAFQETLKFALPTEKLNETIAVICLDFSKPWKLEDDLKKWITVLQNNVKKQISLLPMKEQSNLFEQMKKHIMTYETTKNKGNGKTISNEMDIEQIEVVEELSEGVLMENIGIPLIVAGCKIDLQQKDPLETDYIQYYLRKICLEYGATLIYTSAKDSVNCDVLCHYIVSRIHPDILKLESDPEIVNRDAIFVPSGYDSMDLIEESLMGKSPKWKKDVSFSEMIPKPKEKNNFDLSMENEIQIEDDQIWLEKLVKGSGILPQDLLKPSRRNTEKANSNPRSGMEERKFSLADGSARNKDVNSANLANFFNNLLTRGEKSKTKSTDADKTGKAKLMRLASEELGNLQRDGKQ